MIRLSKSKLISGWQCPKRLWLEINEPELKEVSPQTEAVFAIGHQVGAAVQTLFPEGVLIEHDFELNEALRETEALLAAPGPATLFEATFRAEGVLIRADVLIRDRENHYRLIEVKASTSVKEYHRNDCAIQLWVLEQLGMDVVRVELAHINNQFVYPGDGDYEGLLVYADVTESARSLQSMVPRLIAEMRSVLSDAEPEVPMGAQCMKPFECPFISHCSGPQAEMPVSWLPGGRTAAAKLVAEGYEDIREIPAGHLTNETSEWARRVTVAGESELRPQAAEEMNALGWPRYYFDFETMAPVVPVFAGTSPYKAQAFQWSCHVESADGELNDWGFLATGPEAPMRACAESMISVLGDSGPVLTYTTYELGVIEGFIELFPDLSTPLSAIIERLYDLHPVTRGNYYHPDMHGSWSLKKVLPTVAPDLSYEGLDIVSVGTDAEIAFLEMIDPDTDEDRRHDLENALLRYCKLDTLAMVKLAHFLERHGEWPPEPSAEWFGVL